MTAAALVCGSCGAELRAGDKFCHECAAPVVAAAKPAEYKQVTVLFADVVHSMDIASAVGAERLREIMTELVKRSAAVVQRYGGTLDKFTGDGIMALFGAPVALEDHALCACRAALEIHSGISDLAQEVSRRDGVELQLRIGLNSGQVITGEIGTAATGYTAVGEQVGMAQRMESVAPAGGAMLSESTARLVESAAVLGEPELVQIKGAGEPLAAQRLLGMGEGRRGVERAESNLVGRQWEMAAAEGLLQRAVDGHGAVVAVAGPPGIGKSRLVREVSAMADARDVEVFTTFCESHTSQVPFHAVARLLRAATGVEGLGGQAARDRVRDRVPDADPEDLVLFDDLVGVADPDVELPKIDPDARRRRLTALVNAMSLARKSPAVYVIEDAHWIDEVSESLLADFLTVIPQTPSLVLATYRPEYEGALARVHGAQTIALAALSDPETAALVSQLLGPDSSVVALGQTIAERAAGNPFFVEEIVRELAWRGVLRGEPGAYVSTDEVAEVSVPATLQATIAARIDRLDPKAKRTLSAAAVIGSRFGLDLLTLLGVKPVVDDLVGAELIDQVRFTRRPEYAFRHPLIRTVAYESQLKSDRFELHRRAAAAIEGGDRASADENAALIAEHLEAAGDLHAAFDWHMRAGAWSASRDIAAAWLSWERACQVADQLPSNQPNRTPMCIAPRTLLCGSAWRVHRNISERFDELQDLCAVGGDKSSLTIGMAGLMMSCMTRAQVQEASALASECLAVLESIGDATLTVGVAPLAIFTLLDTGQLANVLRWCDTVIDLADGDPTMGNFLFGSPLAVVLVYRGAARSFLGLPGWREDFDAGVAMARGTDAITHAIAVDFKYQPAIAGGVLLPDDAALAETDEAMKVAKRAADDIALGNAQNALGLALVHRGGAERDRGLELLGEVHDLCLSERYFLTEIPVIRAYLAHNKARRGDRDAALPPIRDATNQLFVQGHPFSFVATFALVDTLLARGMEADINEAEAAIGRLAAAPIGRLAIGEIWLLRLRALLARARGDAAAYTDFRDRYRNMAKTLGFEGHVAWAEAMT